MNSAARSVPNPRSPWSLSTWLFVLLLASSPFAGGPTNGNGFSPGDEVTSLPAVSDVPGITFVGRPVDLRAVLVDLRGRGRIHQTMLASGELAITLTGDFGIELDRRAFAASNVSVLFRGGRLFEDGFARLRIGDGTSRSETERIPLPIGRLAQSSALGHVLALDVAGAMARAEVDARFSADRIGISQVFSRGQKFR